MELAGAGPRREDAEMEEGNCVSESREAASDCGQFSVESFKTVLPETGSPVLRCLRLAGILILAMAIMAMGLYALLQHSTSCNQSEGVPSSGDYTGRRQSDDGGGQCDYTEEVKAVIDIVKDWQAWTIGLRFHDQIAFVDPRERYPNFASLEIQREILEARAFDLETLGVFMEKIVQWKSPYILTVDLYVVGRSRALYGKKWSTVSIVPEGLRHGLRFDITREMTIRLMCDAEEDDDEYSEMQKKMSAHQNGFEEKMKQLERTRVSTQIGKARIVKQGIKDDESAVRKVAQDEKKNTGGIASLAAEAAAAGAKATSARADRNK